MSNLPSGMSDIEQALAEALHAVGGVYDGCRHREDQDDLDAGLPMVRIHRDCEPAYHAERAAAILATPSMQTIARQAAIGAAVERLDGTNINTIERDPSDGKWCISGDGSDEDDWFDTLPDAIAVALEDAR